MQHRYNFILIMFNALNQFIAYSAVFKHILK